MTLTPTSNVNALRLYVPPEFGGILPRSPCSDPCEFEPLCFRGLAAVIETGATVYDVGASYGVMSALSALLAGKTGRVIAFEPNREAIVLGKRFLEQNGLLGRVRHVNALVGESCSSGIPFFFVPGTKGVASTRNSDIVHFHPNAVRTELDMIALDQFDGPVPSVIKVDIEGSEYQFLRGARQLLERHKPHLVMETHALEIDGIGGSTLELCQDLEQLGYHLWDLESGQRTDALAFSRRHAETIGNLLATTHLDEIATRLNRGY